MNSKTKTYYSHGKLLITGEYLVLDGGLALAVPTKFGQSLQVTSIDGTGLIWKSVAQNDSIWFETEIELKNNNILTKVTSNHLLSERLLQILKAAQQLNPNFLKSSEGFFIETQLEFPKNWGLGTSSTLINNIADWAKVDAFELLKHTFGGSGYDIACAQTDQSLTYQLNPDSTSLRSKVQDGQRHTIHTVNFNPSFKDHIYFVHLNQKQDSRKGIAEYRTHTFDLSDNISKVSAITKAMIICDDLEGFQRLMDAHEGLISAIIKLTSVKEKLFNDFKGSIKSLGAWGGDFVMVASENDPTLYFKNKGFQTILSYSEMVKA